MSRRWPAEWEPHERTVMCWPTRGDLWDTQFANAEAAYAEVANAIAVYEPVTMIANPGSAALAAERCAPGVEVIELEIDDSWFRDTGPIFAAEVGQLIATDWAFNSWGGKFLPFDNDAALAKRYAALAGHWVESIDMVLEGGSIAGNGAGLAVTTEQCLLNPNRNPAMERTEIELNLRTHLGIEDVIWLPNGLALDFDTDGHVDNIAAFASTDRLLVQGCNDPSEADADLLTANRSALDEWIEERAAAVEVVEVPVLPFAEIERERVVVPYLNLYVGNGFVLVPTTGHAADADMLDLISDQFPGRDVLGLDVGRILAYGGGGPHCITQQIPLLD